MNCLPVMESNPIHFVVQTYSNHSADVVFLHSSLYIVFNAGDPVTNERENALPTWSLYSSWEKTSHKQSKL